MSDAWFDWTYDGRGWYLVNDPEVTFYGEEEAVEYCDERNRATIEAQAAEIERLTKASDGDVGLMHWQGEKIERLEAEIERLRAVGDSLIDRIAGMAALSPPATIILDPATLAVKAEQ